jgi:hypothetical protein
MATDRLSQSYQSKADRGSAIGAWGIGLYSNEFAMDLRGSVKAILMRSRPRTACMVIVEFDPNLV